ncbi:siderophore-interacting protein [Leclercia adecarboxylata]|uniref:siderophore-interacting protein n=1 Tax=Leclercia adecarboxylata TaxID=83655 RepID=UPI002DBDE043|nr:siderophore-interacting protein [Leclercia adecarboxylata]MEB6377635.1 siderophore-interacting protein [Leclercia adecarboxylata]
MSAEQSYRLFNVELARKEVLSPSMLRCVFKGDDVRHMKTDAPDQRIKLLFPSLNGTPSALTSEGCWWEQLRSLPEDIRPVPRTYTLRRVDVEASEMEVEFVMHGTEGPASAWAMGAQPGDELQIVAPNRDYPNDSGGYEWKPHPHAERGLIIADETAWPAVKGILEQLAQRDMPPQIQVFIEVPKQGDCIDLSDYDFAEIHWLARELTGAPYGEALLQAVKQHVTLPEYAQANCQDLREEAEGELLWDRAESDNRFHGWVAAESSAVKHLRRYLTGERNLSKETISFMAYWARGRRL